MSRKIYDLIAKRLIAAHYKAAIFDYTTITTLVDGRATFLSKGKQQIQEGWRKVLFSEGTKDEDDEKASAFAAKMERRDKCVMCR
ncbi:hypothetical protein GCM10020331_066420 [Ectobacillus funiculus]